MTELQLDDMYRDYCKPAIANKITKTEVLNKINDAKMQCEAVRAYMKCFEREWNVSTSNYVIQTEYVISILMRIEACFIKEVPNDLSKLISS